MKQSLVITTQLPRQLSLVEEQQLLQLSAPLTLRWSWQDYREGTLPFSLSGTWEVHNGFIFSIQPGVGRTLHLGTWLLTWCGTHTPEECVTLCFQFQRKNYLSLSFSHCFCPSAGVPYRFTWWNLYSSARLFCVFGFLHVNKSLNLTIMILISDSMASKRGCFRYSGLHLSVVEVIL